MGKLSASKQTTVGKIYIFAFVWAGPQIKSKLSTMKIEPYLLITLEKPQIISLNKLLNYEFS